MKKQVKVVMLPTEKASGLVKTKAQEPIYEALFIDNIENSVGHQNYHLYLVSDEEIKEGDWMICEPIEMSKGLIKAIKNESSNLFKKIIATTDKSLIIKEGGICLDNCNCQEGCLMMSEYIPQIPQSFIEAYVKAEGKIDEVQVEYRQGTYDDWMDNEGQPVEDIIRTREDNTVIIHKSKENMYSSEDMKSKIQKFRLYSLKFGLDANTTNKWIEENL